MKINLIKKILFPVALSLGVLTGCQGNQATNTKVLEAPSDFSFNFATSEYSFKGSSNATFYSLKVFQYVDGTLDSHAVASSGMIKATEQNDNYSGKMDYNFPAGKYRALVKAIAPRYKTNETTTEGESFNLVSPTVSAFWSEQNSGQTTDELYINLEITANDLYTQSFTTTIVNDGTGATVYDQKELKAGSYQLKASDLIGVTTLTDEDEYTVTVQGNVFGEYIQAPATVTSVVTKGNGFNYKVSSFRFTKGVDSFNFNLGKTESMRNAKATKAETPTNGSTYTYSVHKDTGAPFSLDGTLELKSDNTVSLVMKASGPVQGVNLSGTWSEENGEIVVSKLS